MGFLSSLLGILGFGIGIPIGLLIGYYFFFYSESGGVKDPDVKPLNELDAAALKELRPEIPFWVKNPDYERVDWLNRFIQEMWPYLDKAICATIRTTAESILAEYIGQYQIESIEFENLSLGNLPPNFHGFKVFELNDKELVMESALKWAGNPNVVVAVKVMSMRIRIRLVDLQIFAAPRVTLKPLVPTFPCFGNVVVCLMEKPHVDFGLKVLGLDLMSIPGVYRYVQEIIENQVAELYLWPEFLEISILDGSVMAIRKPVGILRVKVVRAIKLLKMDLFGLSDPYVKLRLNGDRLPSKKTTIKKKTLNPEWNEEFNLTVRNPQSQILHIDVYDWDKVGAHDKLGSQLVPLKQLKPHETKEFVLDLLEHTDANNNSQSKKQRGKVVIELSYSPFKEECEGFSESVEEFLRKESMISSRGSNHGSGRDSPEEAGLLLVTVKGAEDVEGQRHNNPYALVLFRGEKRKSQVMKKTRDPVWNAEFQFMLERPPINDKILIKVISRRRFLGFSSQEALGHVNINLTDVVYNGHINEMYHLIDSKNGVIHVELQWRTT